MGGGINGCGLASLGYPKKRDRMAFWKYLEARALRTQTVASNEWVSERLGMGHPSNVSRALARFQMGKGKEIQRLKVVLAKCTD